MKFIGMPPQLAFEKDLSPNLKLIGEEIIFICKNNSLKNAEKVLKERFMLTDEDVNTLLHKNPLAFFEQSLKEVFGV